MGSQPYEQQIRREIDVPRSLESVSSNSPGVVCLVLQRRGFCDVRGARPKNDRHLHGPCNASVCGPAEVVGNEAPLRFRREDAPDHARDRSVCVPLGRKFNERFIFIVINKRSLYMRSRGKMLTPPLSDLNHARLCCTRSLLFGFAMYSTRPWN